MGIQGPKQMMRPIPFLAQLYLSPLVQREKTKAFRQFEEAMEYSRLSLGSCLASLNLILRLSNKHFVVELIEVNTLEENSKDGCGGEVTAEVLTTNGNRTEVKDFPFESLYFLQ